MGPHHTRLSMLWFSSVAMASKSIKRSEEKTREIGPESEDFDQLAKYPEPVLSRTRRTGDGNEVGLTRGERIERQRPAPSHLPVATAEAGFAKTQIRESGGKPFHEAQTELEQHLDLAKIGLKSPTQKEVSDPVSQTEVALAFVFPSSENKGVEPSVEPAESFLFQFGDRFRERVNQLTESFYLGPTTKAPRSQISHSIISRRMQKHAKNNRALVFRWVMGLFFIAAVLLIYLVLF